MEIGSFFSVTAPNLILSEIDIKDFKKLVALLDNRVDRVKLDYLAYELDMLYKVLDNWKFTYETREDKQLERHINVTKAYYESNGQIGDAKFTREELAKKEAYLKTAKRTYQSYKKDEFGNVTTFSSHVMSFIKVLQYRKPMIKTYRDCIHDVNFSDPTLFGKKLYHLKGFKIEYLRTLVLALLDSGGLSIVKENLATLESYLQKSSNTGEKKSSIDEIDYVLDSLLTRTGNRDVHRLLKDDLITSKLNVSDINALWNFSEKQVNLDYKFFNDFARLQLPEEPTKESMKVLFDFFDELYDAGIIGVNIQYTNMFIDCLKGLTLEKEQEITIDFDSNLAMFILELKELLNVYKEFGEEL